MADQPRHRAGPTPDRYRRQRTSARNRYRRRAGFGLGAAPASAPAAAPIAHRNRIPALHDLYCRWVPTGINAAGMTSTPSSSLSVIER